MKDVIKNLQDEQDLHEEAARKCLAAIRALQAVCPHPAWEDDGHDSHNTYKRCTECGLRR